jgi:transcriptional regulator with XRE-family HTH domain
MVKETPQKPKSSKKQKNARYDAERRTQFGQIIKSLRLAAGLTQDQLATLVQQEYFTFISQVETGRCRIPAADTELWARILGVDPQAFAKECVRYYEPVGYYQVIYKDDHKSGMFS